MKNHRMIVNNYDSCELLHQLIKEAEAQVFSHKLQLEDSKSDFETGFIKGVIASYQGRAKRYAELLSKLK